MVINFQGPKEGFSKIYLADSTLIRKIYSSPQIFLSFNVYKLKVAVYTYKVVNMNSKPSLEKSLGIRYPEHEYLLNEISR